MKHSTRRGGRLPVAQPPPAPEPEVDEEELEEIPPNPEVLAEQLTMILEEASPEDKENVKRSIKARLFAAAQMSSPAPANMSTMDADIDDAIEPYESDAGLLGEVKDLMGNLLMGGRKKKTRKVTRKSKKSRKYSRRR